jgi:hypothetical protein
MTTELDVNDGGDGDEIALPRFEERLHLRLAAAHRAHTVGTGAGPLNGAAVAVRQDRRRRRSASRALQVGVVGIAAAAAGALAVTALTSRSDDPGGRGDVSTAEVDPAAPSGPELAERVGAATEEATATMIVHVTQDNTANGDDDSWFDETSGAHRWLQYGEDGEPSFESSVQGTREVAVDHCFAEYTDGPAGLAAMPGSSTEWVQRGLEDGSLFEDGTEVVDGRELIRLVKTLSSMYAAVPEATGSERESEITAATDTTVPVLAPIEDAVAAAEADLRDQVAESIDSTVVEPASSEDEVLDIVLVDPETYRPVQVTGYPGSDAEYVQTYEYLPRTPENLAALEPVVPDGFTRVERLRGDGERLDADCG